MTILNYPHFLRFKLLRESVSGSSAGAGINVLSFANDDLALVWWIKTPPARSHASASDALHAGNE